MTLTLIITIIVRLLSFKIFSKSQKHSLACLYFITPCLPIHIKRKSVLKRNWEHMATCSPCTCWPSWSTSGFTHQVSVWSLGAPQGMGIGFTLRDPSEAESCNVENFITRKATDSHEIFM